ncbi:hypothetical protein BKA82DRAFT_34916 [Pisolithus tinctorius]|uniref:Uncharacterized protein n=1 Tax=Pisolithus tinctorius Marx 270 TaxID=870435 RepID=A0A0C3JA59_PISTI|nr:hypothetical protein BKA82DRAFT_34916 [Pisolithus tinctorius]KIN94576.1 hypothetical protein M404DRAFT_34916 [Pisolithus tinctorius Marx 270]
MSYFKRPNSTALVPLSVIKTSWEVMPPFPGIDSPFFCPGLHVAAHGYFTDFYPKLSYLSSPHAIANFNGCDLPSITYEDPVLFTVLAFTIMHDTFVYIYYNAHILYCLEFCRLILPLWVWHKHLECHFRGVWLDGSTDIHCVPRWYHERRRTRDVFDSNLLEFITELKREADLGTRIRYEESR